MFLAIHKTQPSILPWATSDTQDDDTTLSLLSPFTLAEDVNALKVCSMPTFEKAQAQTTTQIHLRCNTTQFTGSEQTC